MRDARFRTLTGLLTIAAMGELIVLRSATRTLIHIPGTSRFELPIAIAAELGRLSYYVAVVAVAVVLGTVAVRGVIGRRPRGIAVGFAAALFLASAVAARAGVIDRPLVGLTGLVVLSVLAALAWRGVQSIPVTLFVCASVAAGWSAVGQSWPGGLTGRNVDALMWAAEIVGLLAALTSPLLLIDSPSAPGRAGFAAPLAAGVVTAMATGVALAVGASTLFIVVLWNAGIPGWMPGIAYALAAGTVVATLWSAAARRDWRLVMGLLLLIIAGVGSISTYQTGLAIAGVLVLSTFDLVAEPQSSRFDATGDLAHDATSRAFTGAGA